MRPLQFAKDHPVAVITNMAIGYILLPWLLSTLGSFTGVGIKLPQYGGGGG